MAKEMNRLREALEEFRLCPRAFLLHKAMNDLQEALPAAFDPDHEKLNHDEEEAVELYDECDEALQNLAPKKRERGECSESQCASLSNASVQ